jgi:hypothetical protein
MSLSLSLSMGPTSILPYSEKQPVTACKEANNMVTMPSSPIKSGTMLLTISYQIRQWRISRYRLTPLTLVLLKVMVHGKQHFA